MLFDDIILILEDLLTGIWNPSKKKRSCHMPQARLIYIKTISNLEQ